MTNDREISSPDPALAGRTVHLKEVVAPGGTGRAAWNGARGLLDETRVRTEVDRVDGLPRGSRTSKWRTRRRSVQVLLLLVIPVHHGQRIVGRCTPQVAGELRLVTFPHD